MGECWEANQVFGCCREGHREVAFDQLPCENDWCAPVLPRAPPRGNCKIFQMSLRGRKQDMGEYVNATPRARSARAHPLLLALRGEWRREWRKILIHFLLLPRELRQGEGMVFVFRWGCLKTRNPCRDFGGRGDGSWGKPARDRRAEWPCTLQTVRPLRRGAHVQRIGSVPRSIVDRCGRIHLGLASFLLLDDDQALRTLPDGKVAGKARTTRTAGHGSKFYLRSDLPTSQVCFGISFRIPLRKRKSPTCVSNEHSRILARHPLEWE